MDTLSVNKANDPNYNVGLVLFGGLFVYFVRYNSSTMLSSFFSEIADDFGVTSAAMNGLIFASYPSGLAIVSMYASDINLYYGAKEVILVGLAFATFFNVLFGFVPDILPIHLQQYGFLVCYFLNGFLGGVAETGCTIILTQTNPKRKAFIATAIGTACGVGCMSGPPLGGILYDLGSDWRWKFRVPFLFFAATLALAFALVLCVFPKTAQEAAEERSLPAWRVMNVKNATTFLAQIMSGSLVATLDPTLAYRVSGPPFNYSATEIGTIFMVSSIAFILGSFPVAWMVDAVVERPWQFQSQLCKVIQGLGLVVLGICFAMLGPFIGTSRVFDNVACVWIAMILKGIGSTGCNASFPDLVCDATSNTQYNATMCGLWNATYAFGWATGPLIGGVLYQWFNFNGYATIVSLLNLCYGTALLVLALPTWSFYHTTPTYCYEPIPIEEKEA